MLIGAAMNLPAAAATQAPAPAVDPASIARQNERVKQENILIDQANAASAAQKWQEAVDALDKLIARDPRWTFFQALGNAKAGLGKYQEALDAYGRAIVGALADKTTPADQSKAARAQMLTNAANAFLKLERNDEAVGALTVAATFSPDPAGAYFSLCAVQFD